MSNALKVGIFLILSTVGCFKECQIIVHCIANISNWHSLKMHSGNQSSSSEIWWCNLLLLMWKTGSMRGTSASYISPLWLPAHHSCPQIVTEVIWLFPDYLREQLGSSIHTQCIPHHLEIPKYPKDAFVWPPYSILGMSLKQMKQLNLL